MHPTGLISLWAGAIIDIPAGYVLCDGNNDTPDLRDRFVVAAGSIFSVDETGGSTNHTHTFTGDGHNHTVIPGALIGPGSSFDNDTDTQPATGTTDPTSSIPSFYALAYIMKT